MKFEYGLSDYNIVFNDFESFNREISKCREMKFRKEYALLEGERAVIDINNISEIPNGRFSTFINHVEFECLFKKKDSKNLYIFLSGARNAGESLPIFKRWSYSNFVDGSSLSIADPMFRKYENLTLGWYYGTNEEDYFDYLTNIILKVAQFLNVENKNIIFYGSSGGGFAALQCACRIKESTAIVINPQIDISQFSYGSEFAKITHNDIVGKDKFGRNELISNISNSKQSRFIFIENCRSKVDMLQIESLCKYNGCKFEYGLQKILENAVLWVYDAESIPYHNAQEYPEMFFAISNLVIFFEEIEKYKVLYLYFTELWHERFKLVEKMNQEKSKHQNGVVEISSLENVGYRRIVKPSLVTFEKLEKNGAKKYDFVEIFNEFTDNNIYGLSIESACFKGNECNSYTIVIKNEEESNIVYSKTIRTNKAYLLYFKTLQNARKLRLRIYPNKPELTEGCSVVLQDVNLFCVNEGTVM